MAEQYHAVWAEARRTADKAQLEAELASLSVQCKAADAAIRREFVSARWRHGWWLLGLLRAPSRGFGRFSVWGKARQQSPDVEVLFDQAAEINDTLQDKLARMVEQDVMSEMRERDKVDPSPELPELGRDASVLAADAAAPVACELLWGPIKRPQRALEKVVRTFRRDAWCLTDLCRATLVFDHFWQLRRAFDVIMKKSVVGFEVGSTYGADLHHRRQRFSFRGHRTNPKHAEELDMDKMFRVTRVKNRFDDSSPEYDAQVGYRNVALSIEVGWVSNQGVVDFVPVREWEFQQAERHICEVQLLLMSLYEAIGKDGHRTYCDWRNIMTQ